MSTAPGRTASDEFYGRTGFLLVELGKAAWAGADRELRPLGLSARHLQVLLLAASGVGSQQSIADRTGIDRTTMVALVDDLERLGYARRRRDPADRRRHLVDITDAGTAAVDRASAVLDEVETVLFAGIDAAERDHLHSLVVRVLAAARPAGPGEGEELSNC